MLNRMEESYYVEKKEFACNYLRNAVQEIESVLALVSSLSYSKQNPDEAKQVHDRLEQVECNVRNARRDYEKARWASAKTDLEFTEWLQKELHEELM